MERGAALRSARQDEAPQRRHLQLELIDPLLEGCDVRLAERSLADAFADPVTRIGQPRANGEQRRLNPVEQIDQIRLRCEMRPGQPQAGREFIDLAIRVDARVGLLYARPVEQAGVTGIAGFRIDAGAGGVSQGVVR